MNKKCFIFFIIFWVKSFDYGLWIVVIFLLCVFVICYICRFGGYDCIIFIFGRIFGVLGLWIFIFIFVFGKLLFNLKKEERYIYFMRYLNIYF